MWQPSVGIFLEQMKEPALSRPVRPLLLAEEPPGPPADPAAPLPPAEQIVQAARAACILDESDAKPLAGKLEQPASVVVIDAIDDQPYISSRMGPALQMEEALRRGIELLCAAVGAQRAEVFFYRALFDLDKKLPAQIGRAAVRQVGGRYPAETRALRQLAGQGALVVGAGAAIHLQRAVDAGYPQKSCFITVAGDCVANPGNYEVPLGCSGDQLAHQCGVVDNPHRMVVGGSMSGRSVQQLEQVRVDVSTRGLLLFRQDFSEKRRVCLGCGRCAQVCPEGLNPYYLCRMIRQRQWKYFSSFHPERCVSCYTCSYVCPAKLDIPQMIAAARARHLPVSTAAPAAEELKSSL